jgi:hypothetical protein
VQARVEARSEPVTSRSAKSANFESSHRPGECRITRTVKALAATLLAVAGFAATACGSATKAGLTFARSTTTTVANVKTGTSIHCGGVNAYVPASGGITDKADGPSTKATLRVTRLSNGSTRISCTLSKT